ncbi:hypothetical protein N9D84_03660 [Planktomarina temperata]|nr:hypothetical protein [Planktomarina temperata]
MDHYTLSPPADALPLHRRADGGAPDLLTFLTEANLLPPRGLSAIAKPRYG